jgi:hypothetical protein
MEIYEDSDVEDFKPTVVAWTVILTILGMCAGILGGILYGGIVLFNWIFNL